ncbi:lipoprotein 17-related variable surface protein [[Mycoplasma] anseris]|nr:lipoprotein 17-related variable surface protein [[Mycoplasma] anseris]
MKFNKKLFLSILPIGAIVATPLIASKCSESSEIDKAFNGFNISFNKKEQLLPSEAEKLGASQFLFFDKNDENKPFNWSATLTYMVSFPENAVNDEEGTLKCVVEIISSELTKKKEFVVSGFKTTLQVATEKEINAELAKFDKATYKDANTILPSKATELKTNVSLAKAETKYNLPEGFNLTIETTENGVNDEEGTLEVLIKINKLNWTLSKTLTIEGFDSLKAQKEKLTQTIESVTLDYPDKAAVLPSSVKDLKTLTVNGYTANEKVEVKYAVSEANDETGVLRVLMTLTNKENNATAEKTIEISGFKTQATTANPSGETA